jgi:hypothetical protein
MDLAKKYSSFTKIINLANKPDFKPLKKIVNLHRYRKFYYLLPGGHLLRVYFSLKN